jgi:hypothetical protein
LSSDDKAYATEQRLNALLAGGVDSWHLLSPTAGWSNSGVGPSLQYRFLPWPMNTVELIGDLSSGTVTDPTVFATLPVGYRPATPNTFVCVYPSGTGGGANARVSVETNGQMNARGMTAVTGRVQFHAFISLDA